MQQQQQQLQQKSSQQTVHTQKTLQNETESQDISAEQTFDAVRTAALNMFHQRTRDLTQVAALQGQIQQMENSLAQEHSVVAQLQAQCAQLDAQAEEAEARTKTNEGQVKSVQNALLQLDGDLTFFARVHQSSEKIVHALHHFVKNTVSEDARLMQLMKQGGARIGERTAVDFQQLVGDVRRRTAVLHTHVEEMRASGVMSSELTRLLQEWSHGSWCQHPEMHEVVELSRHAWEAAAQREVALPPSAHADGPPDDSALFHLKDEAAVSTDNAFTSKEDDTTATATAGSHEEEKVIALTQDGNSAAPCPCRPMSETAALLRDQANAIITPFLDELAALESMATAIKQQSEDLGLPGPAAADAAVAEVREDWLQLRSAQEAWTEQLLEREQLESQVQHLARHVEARQAEWCAERQTCEDLSAAQATILSELSLLEEELSNYAHAGEKAVRALLAQTEAAARLQTSLCAAHAMIQEKQAAIHDMQAAMQQEADGHVAHMAALRAAHEERETQFQLLQQQVRTVAQQLAGARDQQRQLDAHVSHLLSQVAREDEDDSEADLSSVLEQLREPFSGPVPAPPLDGAEEEMELLQLPPTWADLEVQQEQADLLVSLVEQWTLRTLEDASDQTPEDKESSLEHLMHIIQTELPSTSVIPRDSFLHILEKLRGMVLHMRKTTSEHEYLKKDAEKEIMLLKQELG